ncbi:anti-sigma factor [Hahella ganghwensis]|uniref:anti-sigma factor n=1 Tax=Hahella ganghwensis TaxID=286420 RepID=UPI00036045BF|nr:anti-sigma factor [Hahella ganghwensis]
MPGSLRYQNPEVQDRLASNYVIGTMRGKARDRFEKIMRVNQDIARRVHFWEEKFQPLHKGTVEVAPKRSTWTRIVNRINGASDQIVVKLLSQLRFYRFLSAAAISVALVVGILSFTNFSTIETEAAPSINYVAVMENNQEDAVMVVTLKKTDRLLSLDILKKPQVPQSSTLQLWAVSREDGSIRSLGVVELKGHTERNLSKAEWGLIQSAEHLIVSVEKTGGSITGTPSTLLVAKGLCVKVEDWQSRSG